MNDVLYYKKYIKYKTKYVSIINQLGGVRTNDTIKLVPKLSQSDNSVTVDLDDIKFCCCEYEEGPVGLTYINFGKTRAKVYMDIRGGWPAYINGLSTNEKQFIDGICIAGGSILGLEATTGVTAEWLKQTEYKSFPGINGSIIYSGNLATNKIYPDKELGRFAYKNLSNVLYSGQVGAGQTAAKGQGIAYNELPNGIKILAIVVNNALGAVYKNNDVISKNNIPDIGKNTTITVVITNLLMDSDELKQMAHQVNCSMAETIRPFNTFADGDVFYACSTCTKPLKLDTKKMIKLYMEMSNVVKDAILKSV